MIVSSINQKIVRGGLVIWRRSIPFVLSTTGGVGEEATTFCKRFADETQEKQQPCWCCGGRRVYTEAQFDPDFNPVACKRGAVCNSTTCMPGVADIRVFLCLLLRWSRRRTQSSSLLPFAATTSVHVSTTILCYAISVILLKDFFCPCSYSQYSFAALHCC